MTGRETAYVDVPGSALGEMLASVGTPAWQVEGALEVFELYRRGVRIPMEAGHPFRREAGQRSDLMSATIPR